MWLQGPLVMSYKFQRHADLNFIFKHMNLSEFLTHRAAWYKTGHKITVYNGELTTEQHSVLKPLTQELTVKPPPQVRISLRTPGWPLTHRLLPASAS